MSKLEASALLIALLTTEDVAELCNVPIATVRKWRYEGTGPTACKLGRHVRYRREDVEAWISERAA